MTEIREVEGKSYLEVILQPITLSDVQEKINDQRYVRRRNYSCYFLCLCLFMYGCFVCACFLICVFIDFNFSLLHYFTPILSNGRYQTVKEFVRDIDLIVSNTRE